jgi:hypothetical protein
LNERSADGSLVRRKDAIQNIVERFPFLNSTKTIQKLIGSTTKFMNTGRDKALAPVPADQEFKINYK